MPAHCVALLRSVEKNISRDRLSRVSHALPERLDAALQVTNLLLQVPNNLNEHFPELLTWQKQWEFKI